MPRIPFDLAARRPYLVPAFSDAEYDRRLAAVRDEMAREGLDALCVFGSASSPSAVAYLTNFAPAFGSAFVVVRQDGGVTVTTDAVLHGEPMHSMIWMCRVPDVRVALGPVYGGAADEIARLAADCLDPGARVGLVGTTSVPFYLHAALAARLSALRPADHVLASVRAVKSDEEIAKLRGAGWVADEAMAAAFRTLDVGVEETAVAAAIVHRIHALGAREAFATCVVGGVQAGLKHGVPRRRALEDGDMVFLDLGASRDGYLSDTSRCAVVGRPRQEALDLLRVGRDLYEAGLAEIRPGATIDDVSRALLRVVAGTRYEPYYCPGGFGHGIGTAVLEPPGLFAGNMTVLRPRMAVAYEPMVVVEGLGTAVVEDTLLITDMGYERLTHYPVVTWPT